MKKPRSIRPAFLSALIIFISSSAFAQNKILSSRLDQILAKKELVVGVNRVYEPFYIQDPKDGFPGFDMELAKLYADYLGVALKVKPLKTFRQFSDEIAAGTIDMALAGMSTDLTRGKSVTFSDPYLLTTPAGLVYKRSLPPEPEGSIVTTRTFKSIEDLAVINALSFSVRSNTTNHNYLLRRFSKNLIYSYLSDSVALDSLVKGNVTCFVADSLYILSLLQRQPSLRASYVALVNPVMDEYISAAMPMNDLVFADNFNFFIKELKRTAVIEGLRSKYFLGSGWVK
ncbi:amino acid ABC transporter substrate-binding protein [Leptospira semungkisensis]|uniref:Amino acid ABC transporter substrate-binding protein n=1 Tax=Leptospira semungkisensis TaxID=2484985 RepID=A0A4R9G6W5_9LEPT|nr:transporter substrate-binding domain-containing protein [Leptospira semungkisensis]TGK07181.1 amino acid ABC transporter substrate-binding protein [Leptospira semungkisensis]